MLRSYIKSTKALPSRFSNRLCNSSFNIRCVSSLKIAQQTSTVEATYLFTIENPPIRDDSGVIISKQTSINNRVKSLITYNLLPMGYPHSVASGYAVFASMQMCSALLSSAGGVLSMQALLSSLGMSSGGIGFALPFAATINWILKDGLGQLGGIIFASFINNRFDASPKKWRMFASISLELSNLLELMSPLVPQYFLPIAAVANTGKNISFLAASASRAAIHKSFALQENLADITGRTGSQNIISSMAGTSLGLLVAANTVGDHAATGVAFAALSTASLAFTYGSLRNVVVPTLTLTRLEMLIFDYFHSNSIVSPTELNRKEGVFERRSPFDQKIRYRVNPPLLDAFPSLDRLQEAKEICQDLGFLIAIEDDVNGRGNVLSILFFKTASTREVLTGLAFINWMRLLHNNQSSEERVQSLRELVACSLQSPQIQKTINQFVSELLEAKETNPAENVHTKWVVSTSILDADRNRISFVGSE